MTVPPLGGGGIAPQNCTIVSQCKSASVPLAPSKNFLWCLVFLMLFFVPTLVSSAIKADSVLRQQWPRGMYSKVSLATGLDAGEAVLHRGRAQWGRRTCMYCTLHASGGACHDHRGSTPIKTTKLRLHQNQRATNHQELTIRTYIFLMLIFNAFWAK